MAESEFFHVEFGVILTIKGCESVFSFCLITLPYLLCIEKELSFCHKLWFSYPYIFATQCLGCFKLWILVRSNNLSLKYPRCKPSDCKDIEIGRKTQFLSMHCSSTESGSTPREKVFNLGFRTIHSKHHLYPITFLWTVYNIFKITFLQQNTVSKTGYVSNSRIYNLNLKSTISKNVFSVLPISRVNI